MQENFFKGKHVLVTGADGFMGSHLTERLVSQGAITSIFIRGTTATVTNEVQLRNIPHIKNKLNKILRGDIGSPDIIPLIKKLNPEHIFHLAADAYVPNSFEHPLEVKKTNVDGTLNILHATMDSDVKQLVCTSSSEIYGTSKEPIDESYSLNPTSPYGASKAAADRYCFAYHTTYGLPVAIIRPFNTYGPRHIYDVTPKFINLALKNQPLTIYGSGEQTRDLTYVNDTINAFLLMCSKKEAVGKAINFGTGKDTTIKELAHKIKQLSNSESEIVYVEKRLSEVDRLCCNPKKAKELFSWEAKIDLDEGLKRNIEWARQKL